MMVFRILLVIVYISGFYAQDPCVSHFEINDIQRSTDFIAQIGEEDVQACDRFGFDQAWYRVIGSGGNVMPTSCPPMNACGTRGPIYLNGEHPTTVGQTVALSAFLRRGDECGIDLGYEIDVKKCAADDDSIFFVYNLSPTPDCPMRYCADGSPIAEVSVPVVTVDTFENRIRFICSFTVTPNEDGVKVIVKWFQGNPGSRIKDETLLNPGSNVESYLQNTAGKLFTLGQDIYCTVEAANPGSEVKKSNRYYAGLKVSPTEIELSEDEKPLPLTIESTVPITCLVSGEQCVVSIRMSEHGRNQILFKPDCDIFFTEGNAGQMKAVELIAKRDFINDGNRNVLFLINGPNFVNVADWDDHLPIESARVSVRDISTAQCSSTGDPHIRTLDNFYYHHYNIGDYVLLESTSTTFRVHARTRRCGTVSCNCGVCAQEGDDIIVVDVCQTQSTTPTVRFANNVQPHPATSVQRVGNTVTFDYTLDQPLGFVCWELKEKTSNSSSVLLSCNNYELSKDVDVKIQITFPSGSQVQFDSFGSSASIYVRPSADNFQHTKGLCGTWDRDPSNDMISKNNIDYPINSGAIGNPLFTESWKVGVTTSCFHFLPAKPLVLRCLPKERKDENNKYCKCTVVGEAEPEEDCSFRSVAERPKFTNNNRNFLNLISQIEFDCQGDLERRSAGEEIVVIPFLGAAAIYDYNPTDEPFVVPEFPTPTGKTRAEVEETCKNAIVSAGIYTACAELFGNFDIAHQLESCIIDTLVMDDFSLAINSAINAMAADCEFDALSNITVWTTDGNGNPISPPDVIGNNLCPLQCNQNGKCINGQCVCDKGYGGVDCTANAADVSVPVVTVDTFENRLRFICSFTVTPTEDGVKVIVKWFQGNPGSLIKDETLLKPGSNVEAYLQNTAEKLFTLGQDIYCTVEVANPGLEVKRSNRFYAGLKVSPPATDLSEDGPSVPITIESTVPIACGISPITQTTTASPCVVTVEVQDNINNQLLHHPNCDIIFNEGNAGQTKTHDVIARRDFINDGDRNVLTQFNVPTQVNAVDWNGHLPIPEVQILAKDVSISKCSSTGDPHITTLDGFYYHHYHIGDYVLLESTSTTFRVHSRTRRCGTVSCNCAVCAQEGNDIVIIDACEKAQPIVQFGNNVPLAPGTSVQQVGNKYTITFTSGSQVEFYSSGFYANIYVTPSADNFQHTRGLCGTWDRDRSNDMISKNNINYPINHGAIGDIDFTESWKVGVINSCFQFLPPTPQQARCLKTNEDKYCTCSKDKSDVNCDLTIGAGRPKFPNRNQVKTFISQINIDCQAQGNRKRRSAGEEIVVIPFLGAAAIYDYNPTDEPFVVPEFPTPTGKTRDEVEETCKNAIVSTGIYSACSEVFGSIDITNQITSCIIDTLVLDDYSPAINSAINAMASDCEFNALSNITVWTTDGNGNPISPPDVIGNNLCPLQCNQNGKCINGQCVCDKGYEGVDCTTKTDVVGVSWEYELHCDESEMILYINPEIVDVTEFNLIDESCVSSKNDSHIEIKTGYHECGTRFTETDTTISFENQAINGPGDGLISRSAVFEHNMKCTFQRTFNNSLDEFVPKPSKVTVNEETFGALGLSLDFYKDDSYNTLYENIDFPLSFKLKEEMFMALKLNATNPATKLVVQQCYATPTNNYFDTTRHYIIKDRCPKDSTYETGTGGTQHDFRFSIEAFEFLVDSDGIYIHCYSILCSSGVNNDVCTFGCTDGRRRKRRSLEDSNAIEEKNGISNTYVLTSPKIILVANEGEFDKTDETNKWKFALIGSFSVIGFAILVVAVLLILKKTRGFGRSAATQKEIELQ